jgi:hypothetical protein
LDTQDVAFDLETVMPVSAFQNRYFMFTFGNAMMPHAKDDGIYGRGKFVAIIVWSTVACPALVRKRCCGCIVPTLVGGGWFNRL